MRKAIVVRFCCTALLMAEMTYKPLPYHLFRFLRDISPLVTQRDPDPVPLTVHFIGFAVETEWKENISHYNAMCE